MLHESFSSFHVGYETNVDEMFPCRKVEERLQKRLKHEMDSKL